MGLILVWFGFFIFFDSVRFFGFRLMKLNRTEYFFLKYSNQFNRFFSCIGFFSFLSLIGFVVFFLIVFLQFSSKTKALLWCYKKTKTILDHDKKHLKSYEVWRKHIWIRGQHGQDHLNIYNTPPKRQGSWSIYTLLITWIKDSQFVPSKHS